MNIKDFRYSVAIRTLGKAGDIYQKELDSLNNQTIRPEKIVVYLAEGYEKPKETIGCEEVVYVKKGMVAQRALDYKEIDSPYILMLDDDVYLPKDAVEKMATALLMESGDCIAADTFPNHQMSAISKIKAAISNWVLPIYSRKWAIKIQRTGSFCYNNNPTKDYYLAQSAAGPCSLWRKEAFLSIHFEDETWLDHLGFAYQDDLLCFYKLYRNGGKMMLHYTSGVKHMDAQSSRTAYNVDPVKFRKRARALFLVWWRTDFDFGENSVFSKILSLGEYIIKFLWAIVVNVAYSIATLSYKPLYYYILGNVDGYKYVYSDGYRKIKNFKITNS